MRVFEIFFGLFVILIAVRIGHFAVKRVTSTDRRIKLLLGTIFLIIIGVTVLIEGFGF